MKKQVGMNRVWSRFLRSAYRREPVSSFILTMGAVDAVIGGADRSWSLVAIGVGAIGVAVLWRWMKPQRRLEPFNQEDHQPPVRYLPSQSSRPSMPMLTPSRKRN